MRKRSVACHELRLECLAARHERLPVFGNGAKSAAYRDHCLHIVQRGAGVLAVRLAGCKRRGSSPVPAVSGSVKAWSRRARCRSTTCLHGRPVRQRHDMATSPQRREHQDLGRALARQYAAHDLSPRAGLVNVIGRRCADVLCGASCRQRHRSRRPDESGADGGAISPTPERCVLATGEDHALLQELTFRTSLQEAMIADAMQPPRSSVIGVRAGRCS